MTQTATQSRISPYWRSLDELENSPQFQEFLHREFPQAADQIPEGVSRRRWMQIMGASFALAGAQGCRWKTETIAPFADRPEGYVPGATTKYATSIRWAGAPRHLLVTSYDGRPIKVDGNPEHPSAGVGSDCYSQAATLSLYDPDRQTGPIRRQNGRVAGPPSTWEDVQQALSELVTKVSAAQGAGLAVLMPPAASVSLKAALKGLFDKLPQAQLVEYEPISHEAELSGARLAFDRPVRTHFNLQDADVIACFDCDLFSDRPEASALAKAYAERRDPTDDNPGGKMNRLYCVESQMTTTGACADHRLPVKSSAMVGVLQKLLEKVESGTATVPHGEKSATQPTQDQVLSALAADLLAAKGRGVVCVGQNQTAQAFALAHKLNAVLGNAGKTVNYTPEPESVVAPLSLADLAGEIAARRVHSLVILGGNPLYDAPGDLDFAHRLAEVETAIHLSPYDDETSRTCHWSLPETHPFETWGDTQAWDGTLSPQQPLIEPLLNTRSAVELVNMLSGVETPVNEFVRTALSAAAGGLDDTAWEQAVHDGFVADSASETLGDLAVQTFEITDPGPTEMELVFTASTSTYDGSLANNGWLQETPHPISKLTWDNAAVLNPATAQSLGVSQGSLVQVTVGEQSLELPVFLQPGQAKGSIGVALGYGRTAAGRVGGMLDENGDAVQGLYPNGVLGTWVPVAAKPVGFDVNPLRSADSLGFARDVKVTPQGGSYLLATVQDHHAIDVGGLEEITKRTETLVREASLEFFEEHPDFAKHAEHEIETPDLFEEKHWNSQSGEGNAWGMAIDLNKCIGCNACAVACQAENNVPVVGKDMVSRGREMHWIRIDRYFRSSGGQFEDNPAVVHQPMTCQQCESAPCEQVCPVAATVHSSEGLNDMVYNRCIGTRYCANNCPFKVRRFNYFHYNWEIERGDWPAGKVLESTVNANRELQQLVYNPEVTLRHRGVMEKCTYCTQRISHARIDAKVEGREIAEGDIKTACQEACSTQAIVFGDLNDKASQVSKLHANDRAYGLLGGLKLRPRTQYLARIRNPHPELKQYVSLPLEEHAHHGHGDHQDHSGDDHHDDHAHGTDDEHHRVDEHTNA